MEELLRKYRATASFGVECPSLSVLYNVKHVTEIDRMYSRQSERRSGASFSGAAPHSLGNSENGITPVPLRCRWTAAPGPTGRQTPGFSRFQDSRIGDTTSRIHLGISSESQVNCCRTAEVWSPSLTAGGGTPRKLYWREKPVNRGKETLQ